VGRRIHVVNGGLLQASSYEAHAQPPHILVIEKYGYELWIYTILINS